MRCAKVVDTPHQIHRTLKRLELACQSTSPTYQNRKARAKCPIKPFDVAHMCSRGGLCLFYQGLYPLGCTPNDASDDPHHSPGLLLGMLLDDLHDAQMVPKAQSRTSPLASEDGGAKHLLNRRNIGSQTIDTQQQRTIQRTLMHLLDETPNQCTISADTNDASQPQASGDSHCHRQPGNATLVFDPYLISLYLTQVTPVLYQMLMNLLAVFTGALLLTTYGTFIYAKRSDNRLKRTPISQERDDLADNLNRIPKTVERCPFALSKCRLALMTDVTLLLATMNTYIPTANFSACRAVGIVTEYLLGIHVLTPYCWDTLR